MEIPDMGPGENIYEYISRVQKSLGTDYVYIVYDQEILGPVRGNVDIETAETIAEYARHLVTGLHPDFNVVVATVSNDSKLAVKRLGDEAYVVVFVPRQEEKVMEFEEIVV